MRRNKLLLLLALLMTAATGAWGMQIYISYPSWPTGTNVNGDGNLVLEMEASDSFENMKAKIEDKSGLNPDYMKLYFNSVEMANNETLNAKGVTSNSVLTLVYTLYNVTMADGTKDAGNWTATVGTNTNAQALPVGGLNEKDAVTLTYNGRLKVKNVTATTDAKPVWDGDLSKLTAESTAEFATATDGMTIKGTLAANVKVSIAAGATVTLDGVTINGVSNEDYKWAGLNCLGNATIVLKDGTTNTVTGFSEVYPGIHVPKDKTLTIQGGTEGNGKLTASSNGFGAGIGGGYSIACGDISIEGGIITAGGQTAAGIGSGFGAICGNITISGGTVTATGGYKAAGIGGGPEGTCGAITIANTVTKVTATKDQDAPYSIGAGGYSGGNLATCGTVTIGGTKYWENNAAVNTDANTYLAQATIVYPNPLATPLTIEAITAGTITVNIDGTLSTGMKYSVNGGTKTTITESTDITVAKDDKVQFYGNGTSTQAYGGATEVRILGSGDGFQTKVYGNIMSLLDETGFATKTELPNVSRVFSGLFRGNATLIDASELLLPAATLAPYCYQAMFEGCTALTTAPKLPATTLATLCYYNMFEGCTSLTSAYVKAAYTEDRYPCRKMFDGYTATGAVLHTTSGSKASWEDVMGPGKEWSNWTVADDWQD